MDCFIERFKCPSFPAVHGFPPKNHAGKTYLSNWPKSYANFSVRPLPGPVMARFWRFNRPLGTIPRLSRADESAHDTIRRATSNCSHHVCLPQKSVGYDARVSQGRISPVLCIARRADALPSDGHESCAIRCHTSRADRTHA